MKMLNCPFCQAEVCVYRDHDPFAIKGWVIGWHMVQGPGPVHPPLRLSDPDWVNQPGQCLGSGWTPGYAQQMADDRAAGLHLRAHP